MQMLTSLLIIIAVLIILLIFWPGIISYLYVTYLSKDKLQLIVTNNSEGNGRGEGELSRLNLHVKIRNSGRNEIEIKAPVLKFIKGKNIRKFQPVISGNTIFPLILNPKTFHEFNIDLNKIFLAKPELKKFKSVRIVVSDRENKIEVVKILRIH